MSVEDLHEARRRTSEQTGESRSDDLFYQYHVPQDGAGSAQRAEGAEHHHRALPHELPVRYQARGLCLLPLRFTKGKALLYLYRPAALQRDLDSDAAAKLLAGAGYPCGSCGGCVAALVRRMRSSAEFPHEVGLFLSYPPEDVKGFIENRAANAKCTGVWKVYGDERQALQTFAKYKKCTQVYCERWQSGSGLDKLAVADR